MSGSNEVSHVLTAMGCSDEDARGALRFSLGRTTTAAEIAEAAELIVSVVAHQREATAKLAAETPSLIARVAATHSTEASAG